MTGPYSKRMVDAYNEGVRAACDAARRSAEKMRALPENTSINGFSIANVAFLFDTFADQALASLKEAFPHEDSA